MLCCVVLSCVTTQTIHSTNASSITIASRFNVQCPGYDNDNHNNHNNSWLKSVNNLLEQLDGTVETAIEEQTVLRADGEAFGQGKDAVESILAKRGFTEEDDDYDDAADDDDALADKVKRLVAEKEQNDHVETSTLPSKTQGTNEGTNTELDGTEGVVVVSDTTEPAAETVVQDDPLSASKDTASVSELETAVAGEEGAGSKDDEEIDNEHSDGGTNAQGEEEAAAPTSGVSEESQVTAKTIAAPVSTGTAVSSGTQGETEKSNEEKSDTTAAALTSPPTKQAMEPGTTQAHTQVTPVRTPATKPTTAATVASGSVPSPEHKRALAEAREAAKEARTLRRHVVRLNSELEAIESEMNAQRSELDRAGERLEKDRKRYKEEKDKLTTRHTEEMKALKKQHEDALQVMKNRSDQQIEEMKQRLKEVEQMRMQEGGDWNKELEVAVRKQQELLDTVARAE